MKARILSWCSALLVTLAATAWADAEFDDPAPAALTPCLELIKKCFMRAGSEKAACFYSAAIDPACSENDSGRLAAKRAALDPRRGDNTSDALGPQLVDQQCLANFDAQWSSMLLKMAISSAALETLDASLERCRLQTTPDVDAPPFEGPGEIQK